jgi:capsular exopolysaccharide synthesis family protein
VDTVVKAYKSFVQEERNDRTTGLLKSLEDKKAEQDQQVAALQQQIREFQVKNPTISRQTGQDVIGLRDLETISSRVMDAQFRLLDAQALYGPGHPVVKKLQQQFEDLQRLYEEHSERYMRQNSKAGQLQQMLTELEQKQEFARRLTDRIRELETSVAGRKLIQIDEVDPPQVSEFPTWPQTNRILAVAIVAGVLLGAGLALLRDRLDGRLRSVEEIQTIIGLPILGVVPAMSGRRTAVARAMTVHLDPRSTVAESYRTIRTAVYFGANGTACKTLLITSPEPGDGKTTSASNLAIAIAQTGRSVLLLDADFRKPTQHKNLDIKDAVGLSSVLAGREPLERAIQRTGVEGLDILPCGPIPANPSEILNSREFGELIDALASRYDHIIFDSPPVNAVTDARILAAVCDATILVLRADKSTRKAGEHARNALLSVGARLLGAIVNDAPRRKGYEVYGGGYYYGGDYGYTPPVSASRRLAAPHAADGSQDQDQIEQDSQQSSPATRRRRDIA